MKTIIRSIISFILFAILGAVIAYFMHAGFDLVYPFGLLIDNWWVVAALLFFSAIFFFLILMLIDVLELIFNPIRKLAPYRVIGLPAIVAYVIFCAWSLYDLWVKFYAFHPTSLDDIVWIKFVMAVLMSLVTIVTFGLCVSSAWGPKDLSSRSSS